MPDNHTIREVFGAGRKMVRQSVEDLASARQDLVDSFVKEAGIDLEKTQVFSAAHPDLFENPTEDLREVLIFLPTSDLHLYGGKPMTRELVFLLRERYPSLQITSSPVLTTKILTK